jgi:Flp pilus assembly CpaF family ATPase
MQLNRDLIAAMRVFLGDAVIRLIDDPRVSEIYANVDHRLRSDGADGRRAHPEVLEEDRLLSFLTGIANDAGVPLDADHPIGDFEMPEAFGSGRLHTKIPPVVAAPVFNLRKSPKVLYRLPDLVGLGSLTQAAAEFLAAKLAARRSILIAGPTYSGKTSFLNALLHIAVAQAPAARYVVLEDVPEVVCPADDTLTARTSDHVSLWDLTRATMRSSPDRIVVGEIRGAEAYPFLDVAASGHPGVLATIHAETPRGALHRLNRLARRGDPEIPDQFELIAEVINVVVCLTGGSSGRRVCALAELLGWSRESGFELVSPPGLLPADLKESCR